MERIIELTEYNPTYRHEIVNKFGYRGERYAFIADHAVLCIIDKGYYIFDLPMPEKQQEYILIQGGYSTSVGFVIPKTIRVYRNLLWYDLWEYRSEDMFKLNPKELNNVGEITKLYSDEYEKWVRRSNSQGKAMLIDAINFKDVKGSKALLDAMFKLT